MEAGGTVAAATLGARIASWLWKVWMHICRKGDLLRKRDEYREAAVVYGQEFFNHVNKLDPFTPDMQLQDGKTRFALRASAPGASGLPFVSEIERLVTEVEQSAIGYANEAGRFKPFPPVGETNEQKRASVRRQWVEHAQGLQARIVGVANAPVSWHRKMEKRSAREKQGIITG